MQIILPSFELISNTYDPLLTIELAGRTAWKSEDKIEPGSAGPFIQRIKTLKHESVLEHASATVRIICDRGITHELVRHRIASFTQESTRYCNYGKGKFGGEITVIKPLFFDEGSREYKIWEDAMMQAESAYLSLLAKGATAQQARTVLPNSLKSEIVVTANFREWRHIFKLRQDSSAHPQMREVMDMIRAQFNELWPEVFADNYVTK